MKILVCGSREYRDYPFVCKVLNEYLHLNPTIISGGARGADALAEQYADDNNLTFYEHLPDWETHGKKAGIMRNVEMYEKSKPDIVIAFWDGQSRGTKHMITYARNRGGEVVVHYI
jgi:hypothetical protein